MRIVAIRERAVPISRHADPALPSGGLTTSIVAVVTDVQRDGQPVVGYGFSSIGRYAQSGLIRERFALRLLAAPPSALITPDGATLDPFRAWDVMMAGEKPGGHGERCVAVGTLDMAPWDAAAKILERPLADVLVRWGGAGAPPAPTVPVYAGGGYYYPRHDRAHLTAEIQAMQALGYQQVKIKIGGAPLAQDIARIEAVLALLPASDVAVDAMNAYDAAQSEEAVQALAPYGLRWWEDVRDPLDFETLAAIAASYPPPLAAGEALFSLAEARLLARHGGLRPAQDLLLFDPVHCYGLPGYLRIVTYLCAQGWPRSAFWPHGGHLFGLHVVSALGLGGAEVNPLCFQPFGGLADGVAPSTGHVAPPRAPGIGFELKADLHRLVRTLLGP